MRRPALLCLVLLLAAATGIPALSRADFDRVVDFSVTLKTLAAVAEGKAPMPGGRMLLLSGTVSDINVLSKDDAGFRVRVELIAGEWIGLEDVRAYACYVDFSGAEFSRIFPARPPREPTPGVVALNSRVIVVGTPVDIVTSALGQKRVLLRGAYIRVIE